jgi:F0F1-type ATP synthase assembly protein I
MLLNRYNPLAMKLRKLSDLSGEGLFLIQAQLFLCVLFCIMAQLSAVFEGFWVGASVCLFANSFFYRRLFAAQGAQELAKMMRAFYWGQFAKWCITIALFSILFKLALTNPLGVLVGYSLAQLLNLLLLFYSAKKGWLRRDELGSTTSKRLYRTSPASLNSGHRFLDF